MSLFGNYDTPGKGVPKAPMEKKGIFKFFEVYGRRFWKLLQLNIIYVVFCIPVVTFGPATAAMTKVARNYSQERNAFVFGDFIDTFKKCFKQSFIMGIIDVVASVLFYIAINVYYHLAQQNSIMYILLVIAISLTIIFFMMHFYIYLMIVSTNLSLKHILKNSLFLVSLGLKGSIITLLTWVLVVLLLVLVYPFTFFVLLIWPLSFMCFVTSFNCYPTIRKYVIQPYYDSRGEDNPEFDYLKAKDDEVVFEDNPEIETVPEKKQTGKKGKVIK
ncbi:MAG: YesL family protein [Ruminococcus sp.]|nr:YesL family protein [Ruminococcus sp.]